VTGFAREECGVTPAPQQFPLGSRVAHAPQTFFQEAVAYAARAHRHQLRKDGKTPYVAHVVRVTLTLMHTFGCDDPIAIQAAILHDTIEDTTTDYEDIADRFGDEVARCVAALTKNMALPDEAREREYDQRLATGPWQARLIKIADTFDNLCDVQDHAAQVREEKLREATDRARRAILLAASDAHPAIRRGVQMLEGLIAGMRG
jgi:(p)ppGpp synthase/HD superfamily hydrolase